MPFHIEFRPKNFGEVLGNEEVVNVLQEMLSRENKPHSYLLVGPSGCGKTTIGRIIASELKCHPSEYFEFNTADDRTLEFVRSVLENVTFRPTMGKVKFLLFDECHTFTSGAQEALLKLIEAPPPYVFICLCTTAPEKLILTIKNRCETFTVRPVNDEQMVSLLFDVINKKELKVSDKVFERIHDQAEGCPRRALLLLEKVCNMPEEKAIQLIELIDGNIKVLCAKLLNRQKDWSGFVKILTKNEDDPENLRRGVLGYMQKVMLNHKSSEMDRMRASEIIEIFGHSFWEGGKPKLIQSFYKSFLKMMELK